MSVTDERINQVIPVSNTGTAADSPKRTEMRELLKEIRDAGNALKPWTPTVDVNNKLDETAYPANATGNIFEITGTATPLQWDALGGTVVDGDLVAFDSAGVPRIFNADDVDLSGYATEEWVEDKGYVTNEQIGTDVAPLDPDGLVPSENLPSLFSGDYDDLTNRPTLFSGAYDDLTDKPTIGTDVAPLDPDGLVPSENLPPSFSGAYDDLSGKPTLFSGAYDDLSGKPTLFSGAYNDLSGKPTFGTMAFLADAVSDGKAYARKDGEWVEVDKTLLINWLEVTTSTFLIEPEHAGMSLWITADCVITVSAHSTLPIGFNCEILKADASLIVSVVASGVDTIRDGKLVIVSDASVFKSPSVGVIGLVGDVS